MKISFRHIIRAFPLHSTVTALLEATDNWAFNTDHGKVNAVVLIDLKKAFDIHPMQKWLPDEYYFV